MAVVYGGGGGSAGERAVVGEVLLMAAMFGVRLASALRRCPRLLPPSTPRHFLSANVNNGQSTPSSPSPTGRGDISGDAVIIDAAGVTEVGPSNLTRCTMNIRYADWTCSTG